MRGEAIRARMDRPCTMKIIYHLSSVGKISVPLHAQSSRLYDLFRLSGEVERLQQIHNLGLIHSVYHSAHHPKWEYMVLNMHLVELAKSAAPHLNLASNIKTPSGINISKTELIKIWILLFGAGHLPWTFTAERAFLSVLKRHSPLRGQLEALFENPNIKKEIRRILRNEEVFSVYHLITFWRILQWKELEMSQLNSDSSPLWNEAVLMYLSAADDNPSLQRVKETFRLLRQIAYLCLDLHYIPNVVEIDLRDILLDNNKLADLLGQDFSAAAKMLDGIQNYLNERLYINDAVISRMETPFKKLESIIRKDKKHGVGEILQSLLNGRYQRKIGLKEKDVKLVLRMPFRVEEPFAPGALLRPARQLKEEAELTRAMGSNHAFARVFALPNGHEKDVDVFFKKNVESKQIFRGQAAVCRGVLKYLSREVTRIGRGKIGLDPLLVQNLVFSQPCAEFVRHVLRRAMGYNGKIEIRAYGGMSGPVVALCRTKSEALKVISVAIGRLGKSRAHQVRRDELIAARAVLKKSKGKQYVVVLGPMYVLDNEGNQVDEVDGFFMTSYYTHFDLYFVESKCVRHGCAASTCAHLENLMNKTLQLRPRLAYELPPLIRTGPHSYYGYVRVRLDSLKDSVRNVVRS